jgi:uncharacterized membrane protein
VARPVIPNDRRAAYAAANSPLRRPAVVPGVLIGAGLGGFADGIVLHQIFQVHNMLSAWLPPVTMEAMRVNMVWDGYFHVLCWAFVLAGAWGLWAAGRSGRAPSARGFFGQLLLGFGLFNLVEGVIDHHVLQTHHVVDLPRHVPAFDWLFLAVGGGLMLVVGWALARRS